MDLIKKIGGIITGPIGSGLLSGYGNVLAQKKLNAETRNQVGQYNDNLTKSAKDLTRLSGAERLNQQLA